MKDLISSLLFLILLSVCAAVSAQTQQKLPIAPPSQQKVLPIWNQGSNKIEGFLYLDIPTEQPMGMHWRMRTHTLDTSLSLSSGNTLGLLCSHQNSAQDINLHGLAGHCMLARFGEESGDHQIMAMAALNSPHNRFGVGAGVGRDRLPDWLPSEPLGPKSATTRIVHNDLTVYGLHGLGKEGFVSFGGTLARARFVSLADASPALTGQWNSKSLSLGGGYGAFSANIIGRVIDVPGRSDKWEGLGLGLTWRTPWSGHLSVGAENIISRGKNPFSPDNEFSDTGTTPYVRYEQDL